MTEHNTIHGKWSDPGVPHRSWTCTDVEDLGEPSHICEMCEMADIRYVHYMEHPDYPTRLAVGCVCNENMSGDYIGPKRLEKGLKNLSALKARWLKRKWLVSAKGNQYIKSSGYIIVIIDTSGGWTFRITHKDTNGWKEAKQRCPTEEKVKIVAAEALVWVKENWKFERQY